jgi:hypothetical protein
MDFRKRFLEQFFFAVSEEAEGGSVRIDKALGM